jgi:Zn-dependent protease with chaperone function
MSYSLTWRRGFGAAALAAFFGFAAFAVVLPAQAQTTTTPDYLTTPELFGAEDGIDFAAATGLGDKDVRETIGAIIRVTLGFLGIVAVVIILLGGFKWMTAGGNEEKVTEAKKLIIAGIIGLAIILSAYAIAEFVIDQLVAATTG